MTMAPFDEADDMCPNCVTPWKCNGPHFADQTPYARRDPSVADPTDHTPHQGEPE